MTSGEGLTGAIAAAEEALGPIDIAVNCAGVATIGRILNRENVPLPLEQFEPILRVNLVGTFNLLRLAAARMAGRPPEDGERGVIVLTAGTSGNVVRLLPPLVLDESLLDEGLDALENAVRG